MPTSTASTRPQRPAACQRLRGSRSQGGRGLDPGGEETRLHDGNGAAPRAANANDVRAVVAPRLQERNDLPGLGSRHESDLGAARQPHCDRFARV